MKIRPFNTDHFIGYVSRVAPQYIEIHFPSSGLLKSYNYGGESFNGGLVGEFVIVEDERHGFLGKINEVYILEKERSELSETTFKNDDFQPVGKVELFLSFDHFEPFDVKKGLSVFPQVGSKVYVSSPSFVKNYVEKFGVRKGDENFPTVALGGLLSNPETKVNVSQQALFGRHCAVVGTTGGGKSWTLSRLIGEVKKNNTKAIIIDATGEYEKYSEEVTNIKLGADGKYFHYKKLTTDDLFYLLKPSERTQSPKLLDAVRSLKMVRLSNGKSIRDKKGKEIPIEDGVLKKENKPIRPYHEFYFKNVAEIESNDLNFDIKKLASQVTAECIFQTGRTDNSVFGGRADNDVSNCVPLISRINEIIYRSEFNNVFGFQDDSGDSCITKELDEFFANKDGEIIRIDFSNVKFEFQSREILANAIANYFLIYARNTGFREKPVVLFVDEAHQFLNKSIKDEYFLSRPLEAFDLIAKECRKYGLFLCLSTQIPRDIPTGTLSQMGTFIAHRLINHFDKEAIANACSSANRNSLNFLPILGEGEALMMGVDFPMPLLIKVDKPEIKPESDTPKFKL
jgi:energy-coupling factor transporter ATP-binding protein EcfA2